MTQGGDALHRRRWQGTDRPGDGSLYGSEPCPREVSCWETVLARSGRGPFRSRQGGLMAIGKMSQVGREFG